MDAKEWEIVHVLGGQMSAAIYVRPDILLPEIPTQHRALTRSLLSFRLAIREIGLDRFQTTNRKQEGSLDAFSPCHHRPDQVFVVDDASENHAADVEDDEEQHQISHHLVDLFP